MISLILFGVGVFLCTIGHWIIGAVVIVIAFAK